jgi:hypothetical protein
MDYLKQSGQAGKSIFSSASKMTSMVGTTSLKTMGSMGKAVTGAVTSLPTLSTDINKSDSSSKRQIVEVLSLLGDIRLQSSPKHSGLILAYTSATLAPLNNPGLKFRFYKMSSMSSQEQFEQVDESQRAWYAPTIDDIGSKICIQCEDNFDQGFSRYLESTVIEVDDSLVNAVENALQNEYYGVKDTGVTFGIELKSFADRNIAGDLSSAYIRSRPSVLSSIGTTPYMQLEGTSDIEVDSKGIFVFLPVPPRPDSPATDASVSQMAESASMNSMAMRTASSPVSKPLRRGLLIPPSDAISVECTQPVSLVITIPIARENPDGSSYSPLEDEGKEDASQLRSDVDGSTHTDVSGRSTSPSRECAKEASQTAHKPRVALPWTYVRNLKSEETQADQSAEQVEGEKREAASFTSIVESLEEFLHRVPSSKHEIKICISCGDRAERDALVCMIRAMAIGNLQPEERIGKMPWRHRKSKREDVDDNESNHTETFEHQADIFNNKIDELMAHINDLEIEKESLLSSQAPPLGTDTSADDAGASVPGANAGMSSNIIPEGRAPEEVVQILSTKVQDLESKVAIWTKREKQALKDRQKLEQRNVVLRADLVATKGSHEVTESKCADASAQLGILGEASKNLRKDLEHESEKMSKARVLIKVGCRHS